MITTETKGSVSLKPIENYFLETLTARTAAKVAGDFSGYLKKRRFDELFQNRTGETRKSIGTYRAKGNAPAYLVKAGIGIPGSLNYLAGLYKGFAKSRSGKWFFYKDDRYLIEGGWASWGGDREVSRVYESMLKKTIGEAEEKLES